nr:MAG: hypothetical protein [Enquatrovirus sp.]
MIKLKKYTLNRMPKFIVYSLHNSYLNENVKHIKVFNYTQNKDFQEVIDKFFIPSHFKLLHKHINNFYTTSLHLDYLIFLVSSYKDKAPLIKFVQKLRFESDKLKPHLYSTSKYFKSSPDYTWEVRITLVDTEYYI